MIDEKAYSNGKKKIKNKPMSYSNKASVSILWSYKNGTELEWRENCPKYIAEKYNYKS